MMSNSGDNPFVKAIIERYLKVQNTSSNKLDELADELVQLILQAFDKELRSSDVFNLPYKDIADSVFGNEKQILTGSLTAFAQNMEKSINLSYDTNDPNRHHKDRDKYVKRFMYIHNKIVEHILLTQVQKDYIKTVAKQANEIAKEAKIAADSANNTYKSMFANYITILGIFTAVIVTIFGGLNVANTILDYGNAPFSTIVFLTALVLMCVICLLYFLALIVMKLTDQQNVLTLPCQSKPSDSKTSNSKIYTLDINHFIIAFMIICIVAMFGAYCSSPNKTTPVAQLAIQEQKSTP